MTAVERDPAGLLERVPELARLAEAHVALRRAIEQGRPHAVYRALFWIRLLQRAGQDAALVTQLLSNRRLFIQPLNGTPAMMTYNGFGSRPYGSAEPDPADGSHILTLYLTALYLPVYPFSAYLVRPAARGWTFFGKVPLSTSGYLWQRSVALFGLIAVVFGVFNAIGAMRYNTVQLVNALPVPVQVRVGSDRPVTVSPNRVEKVRSKVGPQEVIVQLGGKVIEHGQLEVKRGYDVDVWNVLGAGPVYRADVVYTAKGSSDPGSVAEPELMCGERVILRDGIDYVFTTPPSELSMSESESVTHRSHFGLAEVPPMFCVFKLGRSGKLARAKELARDFAQALDYDFAGLDRLVDFFDERDERPFATELADAARKHHDAQLDYHRLYQSQAIALGRRADVITEYRERLRQQPDSADAAYLLGRVLTGPEADRLVSESQRRFPGHAYLLRSAAYRAMNRADFAEVARLTEQLRSVDPKSWQGTVGMSCSALAAAGRIEQARELVNDWLRSPNLSPSDQFEAVVDAELLAHWEPKAQSDAPLGTLHGDNAAETNELRLLARVRGCEPVTMSELEQIEDKALKSRIELEILARKEPNEALARLSSASDTSPGITAATWALLLAEAARLDEHHPALAQLQRWGPTGRTGATALIDYALHGTASGELEELTPEMLAAADFVRSRTLPAGSAEREALRARAAREDLLHGAVSVAMNEWPQ